MPNIAPKRPPTASSSSSFARYTSSSKLAGNSESAFSKRKSLTKPAWDATNSDLTQFKSTNDEMEQRRNSHKSKNFDLVKQEKQLKQPEVAPKSSKKVLSQLRSDSKSQLGLLKEILHDDEQLRNLILKSDSTLKVVQNFFSDDANENEHTNKKQAKICMTLAPNVTDLDEPSLPHYACKPKKGNVLAEVKVNHANNISNNDEDDCLEDGLVAAESRQQQLAKSKEFNLLSEKLNQLKASNDLEKYNQLAELKKRLLEEQRQESEQRQQRNFNAEIKSATNVNVSELQEMLRVISAHLNENELGSEKEPLNTNMNPCSNSRPSLTSLNEELKRALTELDQKLVDFESLVGRQQRNSGLILKKSNSSHSHSSSCTLSLIQTVSRLLDYVREVTVELNYEKLKQSEMNKQLDIHRKLIDGLTTEILCVREQNEKIAGNCASQSAKFEAEIEQVKRQFKSADAEQQQSEIATQISQRLWQQQLQQQLPPIIDSRPKQSAFSTQSSNPSEVILKPVAQSSSNNTNSNNNDINQTDRFSERLSAMLQQDAHFYENSSVQQQHQQQQRTQSVTQSQRFPATTYQPPNRPMSATAALHLPDMNLDQIFVNNSCGKLSMRNFGATTTGLDFSQEICELKAKNQRAHEKLRQLQLEQQQMASLKQESNANFNNTGSLSNSVVGNNFNNSEDNSHSNKKKELLDKLKQEQQMLKEQIGLLNRQRESAQHELEILATSSNGKLVFPTAISQATIKSLYDMNTTPNLSPISTENVFHQIKQ